MFYSLGNTLICPKRYLSDSSPPLQTPVSQTPAVQEPALCRESSLCASVLMVSLAKTAQHVSHQVIINKHKIIVIFTPLYKFNLCVMFVCSCAGLCRGLAGVHGQLLPPLCGERYLV